MNRKPRCLFPLVLAAFFGTLVFFRGISPARADVAPTPAPVPAADAVPAPAAVPDPVPAPAAVPDPVPAPAAVPDPVPAPAAAPDAVAAPAPTAAVAPTPALALESWPTLEQSRKLRWNPAWPRFRPVEYAATGVMLAGTIALALDAKYRKPLWYGGILFDDSVRSALRASSASGRQRAHKIGTDLYLGSMVFSVADALVSAWAIRGSSDVAAQMLLIDVEAYSLVGLLQFSAATFVRRERPYQSDCRKGVNPGFPGCSANNADGSLSFFAGHPAIAFTNAGLTCAHHLNQHLYGTAGDASMCALTIASASVVAYTRIASDKHYATDDLTGVLIGATVGFLTPSLLHYRAKRLVDTDASAPPQAHISAVLPSFSPNSLGLAMSGEF